MNGGNEMIDEKKLIAKLEKWAKESKEESGLKEPALLRKETKITAIRPTRVKTRSQKQSGHKKGGNGHGKDNG